MPGVIAAPQPPRGDPKGPRFATGFLARLLSEKFVLARRANKVAAALSFDGLDVAEGTLAGVFAGCAPLLEPLERVFAAVGRQNSHKW